MIGPQSDNGATQSARSVAGIHFQPKRRARNTNVKRFAMPTANAHARGRSALPRNLLLLVVFAGFAAVSGVPFPSGATASRHGNGSVLAFAAANSNSNSNSNTNTDLSDDSVRRRKSISLGNIITRGSLTILPKLQPPQLLPPSVYDNESQAVPALLDLTPREEALIRLLRKVRDAHSPRTTVRIAGGWVRDKLVYGRESPSRDIDLVLSDTTGRDFAQKVRRYAEEADDEDAADVRTPNSGGKGVHADHLQTATLLISGFDVDFCHLRYERYDEDSRIPSNIGVASAVEDAWRRDLTINALYYNINTNEVEDWTERGMIDLVLRTIATPKKPLPTLLEDPTRILRAVRFAAQLSFRVSPALIRAARDERVRYALQYKVSRDAVGEAIDQMLGTRARDPSRGIQLLMATDLIDVVFPLGKLEDGSESTEIYKAGLGHLTRTQSLVTRIFLRSPDSDWDISKRRLLWYAAFFKPVYEMMSTEISSSSKRGRRQESVFYQLLDAMKRPKTDMQSIESILKAVDPLQMMISDEVNNDAIQSAIHSGACLRDELPHNSQWEELSELRWIIYSTFKPIGTMWKEALILALASSLESMADCVDSYHGLVSLMEDNLHLGKILLDNDKPKPLLNGSQIQGVFLGQIDGQGFKRIVQAMEEWQIRNICYDFDSADNDEQSQTEARLVDYLVTTFPEYATAQASQSLEG